MINENEVWRVSDVVPTLEVSNFGCVRYLESKLPKRKNLKDTGYEFICMSINKTSKAWYVHRLIASAFFGQSNLRVNHKDGNRANNSLDNLEYVTDRENVIHSKGRAGKVGTSFCNGKWQAMIRVNGLKTYLGSFKTQEEANKAYLKKLGEIGEVSKYA